jgi:hypothetical protein
MYIYNCNNNNNRSNNNPQIYHTFITISCSDMSRPCWGHKSYRHPGRCPAAAGAHRSKGGVPQPQRGSTRGAQQHIAVKGWGSWKLEVNGLWDFGGKLWKTGKNWTPMKFHESGDCDKLPLNQDLRDWGGEILKIHSRKMNLMWLVAMVPLPIWWV